MPRHIYNLVPSRRDHRDFLYFVSRDVALPAAADLGKATPPIRDQGQEGSCTGFSITSARTALALRTGDATPLSPAFLYYKERETEHDVTQDAGAEIRDGLDVLVNIGCAPEADFPYVAGQYATPPPVSALADAGKYKAAMYQRLPGLAAIKHSIVIAQPVILGIAVYQSFEAVGADGRVPYPSASDSLLGGHAILCVGYRDDATAPGGGWLVLNNSWGPGAGDQGRYYLSYAYAINPNLVDEAWTLTA